jgi:uncharacterized membrane protein SpoIIM required for sporulation
VDLDSYILRHGAEWDRLAELSGKRGDLTGDEADEVVDLYQRVSTHLSVIRSTASDPVLEARLSALVANARSVVTGVTLPIWQTIGHFFTAGFPAAVYRARHWWITIALVNVALAFLVGWRVVNTPGLGESLLSDAEIKQLVDHDFAAYYSDNTAADFAFQVWLNNAEVTAICLVMGVVIVPVLVLLWMNIANVGVIGGFMVEAGRADVFYGLLLPHGLLELTIVFVAAAAGLRLGWSWIAPGPRTRSQALATEGRRWTHWPSASRYGCSSGAWWRGSSPPPPWRPGPGWPSGGGRLARLPDLRVHAGSARGPGRRTGRRHGGTGGHRPHRGRLTRPSWEVHPPPRLRS